MACCKSLITSTISSACKISANRSNVDRKMVCEYIQRTAVFKKLDLGVLKITSSIQAVFSREVPGITRKCPASTSLLFAIFHNILNRIKSSPFTDYKLSWKCLKRTNLAIVIDCASVVPSTVRTGTWYFNLPFILALVQVFYGIVIVGFFGNDNQEVFGLCKILAEGV